MSQMREYTNHGGTVIYNLSHGPPDGNLVRQTREAGYYPYKPIIMLSPFRPIIQPYEAESRIRITEFPRIRKRARNDTRPR